MKDALNNDVIIGKEYGYSTTDSVITGTARNFTKTCVTIVPTSRRFFIYGEETDKPWQGDAATISVRPFHLFPINRTKDSL